jgi:hypothetical protein
VNNWANKNDLLSWLQSHAPTPSTKRALQSGQAVIIIGGFRPLPDSNSPGFIVRVVSKAEKVYHIAITVDDFRDSRTYVVDYIDWKTYCGMESKHELYRGDVPEFARHQKLCNVFERLDK